MERSAMHQPLAETDSRVQGQSPRGARALRSAPCTLRLLPPTLYGKHFVERHFPLAQAQAHGGNVLLVIDADDLSRLVKPRNRDDLARLERPAEIAQRRLRARLALQLRFRTLEF